MLISPRLNVAAVLLLLVTLSLAACAKAAPVPTPAPTPAPAPAPVPTPTTIPTPTPTGPYGQLTVADSASAFGPFDPILGTVAHSLGVSPLFDLLIKLDDNGGLAPGIVTKWEIAPDGLSWVYDIRKGIKFQNGEDLTAADVKLTFDRYISDKAIGPEIRTSVKRIEIVDDYTVRLYTIGTQPFLPYFMAGYSPSQGSILPKDYLERVGAEYFNLHPVGAGPFKFVRHVPGDMLEYEAFDKYWGQVPAFKKLTLIAMAELTTRIAVLKTGLADIATVDVESAGEMEAAGFKVVTLIPDQPSVICYGAYDPRAAGMPTTDVRVRQALSLAINQDEIRKTLLMGRGFPIMPPFIFKGSIDVDYDYWEDYMAKTYRYDPEEAKRLLKEAGYPQGFNIKLWTFVRSRFPQNPKLMEVVQGYWLKIGVKAELVNIDGITLFYGGIDRIYRPMIGQASAFPVQSAPITPVRVRSGFHSLGSLALLGRERPDIDKLIEDAQSEINPAKRRELTARFIKEIVDTYTWIPMSSMPVMVVVAPRVDLNMPTGISPTINPYLAGAKHRKP